MPTDDVLEQANVAMRETAEIDTWVALSDLAAALRSARERIAELEGASSADENRLRQASESAGVGYFGCDTPEVLADTIADLRTRITELERDRERLDWLERSDNLFWVAVRGKASGGRYEVREKIDAATAAEKGGE